MQPVVRLARSDDLPAVLGLLRSFELPTAGVAEQIGDFLVAEDNGRLVACAGLEIYGQSALLRSVAVREDYRNRGLARLLVTQLLARARQAGIGRVYLLTSTAAAYFAQLGFAPVAIEDIDPSVRAAKEFSDACCADAQPMRLVLPEGHPAGGREVRHD